MRRLRPLLSGPLMLVILAAARCTSPGADPPEPAPVPDADVEPWFGQKDTLTPPPSDTGSPDVVPSEDQGPAPDAPPGDTIADAPPGDTTADGADGCDCPAKMHCDDDGLCQADVCTKGATTCATPTSLKICAADGASFTEAPCPPDEVCQTGQCLAPVCTPNEPGGCEDEQQLVCNSLGTEYVAMPCPSGELCSAGACRPIPPNILLLVDSSGSMNWLTDGSDPLDCFGGSCPDWSFPDCDTGTPPQTRLGKVKHAITEVLASDEAIAVHWALGRFPQVPFTKTLFSLGPFCDGGYWDASGNGMMTGDSGEVVTAAGGWFTQHLAQVIAVPFPAAGATDLALLASWFDNAEYTAQTPDSCASGSDCEAGPCLSGQCHVFTNPELRAVGGTPLGKSLFYAGEYFRHFVLVQGKPCATDTDCGITTHSCVDGVCHDPFAYCRPNVVIAFSDGEETEHVHVDDYFHPRVQAKRLHYGLGCAGDADCLAGATCEGGVCTPPSGEIDETAMVCEAGGLPCTSASECPDPCGAGGCPTDCLPAGIDFVSGAGGDVLTDQSGVPMSLTVHVVDASGVAGANELIAKYGGGLHFSVDLSDPTELVASVDSIIGNAKDGATCD